MDTSAFNLALPWEIHIRTNGLWEILYRGNRQKMEIAFKQLIELGYPTGLVINGRVIKTNDRVLAAQKG
ncbi:MAG: hypothetical protein JO235_09305 [Chroococcidiopsidaceae cyanobacterium CP_BM_RX_35]|nr:hypothetical protein [Chroococcidiopsidaceae cyanobacterium CP_BM_RX_35]